MLRETQKNSLNIEYMMANPSETLRVISNISLHPHWTKFQHIFKVAIFSLLFAMNFLISLRTRLFTIVQFSGGIRKLVWKSHPTMEVKLHWICKRKVTEQSIRSNLYSSSALMHMSSMRYKFIGTYRVYFYNRLTLQRKNLNSDTF